MNILQAIIILSVASVTYGLTCLSCESVAHPFLCEHTMRCLEGSICSVEKFVNSGDISYKLGCIDTTKCHSKRSSFGTDIETCRECCSTDGCNLKGCGKDTINIKRGPICFDCDGISDPTNCHRVKVCEVDELCLTQETFRWNVRLFKTSCENVHVCQALGGRLPVVGRRKRSYSFKHKRSVLCTKCCSINLCNTHCGSQFEMLTTTFTPSETTHMQKVSTEVISTATSTDITFFATTKASSKSIDAGYYEFYIMFTESYEQSSTTPQLYIFSTQTGTATIFSMHENKNESIQLSIGENKFDLRNSVVLKDGTEHKGVKVHASVPIIVYPFSLYSDASDGYLAIPTNFLSNLYIVPSFSVYQHNAYAKSVIGVVSTVNNVTDVKIKLNLRNNTTLNFRSTEFNNGDTLSVSLLELDTLQISHNFDLSGSIITSSQPVGVVSGNKCNSIRRGTCNHFTEMILPTTQLDNNFIIPNVKGRSGSIVRVYCPLTAQLQIFTLKREFNVTVQKEDFYEFEDSDISIVKSDKNVLVMSYPIDNAQYDSYMMTVFGINQYKTTYDIVVPGRFTSYISMTLTSGSVNGFQIDNNIMLAKTHFNKTISGTTYTTVSLNISPGAHAITHQLNISFGLWIYGDRPRDGYGFPGGIAYTYYP